MRKEKTLLVALTILVALGLSTAGRSEKGHKNLPPANGRTNVTPAPSAVMGQGSPVYAEVALYDVSAGQAQAFESAIRAVMGKAQADANFINARVLKNLDDLALQYATYVRYANRATAEGRQVEQTAAVRPFCWRDPETHLIQLQRAYFQTGITDSPSGSDFAAPGIGEIAHLGMWIPFPRYRQEYNKVLDRVKVLTREQRNFGYIGEEVGAEVDEVAPGLQTPYSPHAFEPEPMSINYGEFKTFQQAEESFLAHQEDRDALAMWRIFFGSLQVPTRFYLFQLVQSYQGAVGKEREGEKEQDRKRPRIR